MAFVLPTVDHVGLAIQAAQKRVSLKKLFDDVKRTQEERVRLETEYRDSVHVMKQKKALAERQSPRFAIHLFKSGSIAAESFASL